MMHRIQLGFLALAIGAVALAGCGGGSKSGSSTGGSKSSGLPSTIKVGFLDSMTGLAGFCGKEELEGAELAVEDAEKSGLLGKSKVSLEVSDDKSSPPTAVTVFHKLISDSEVAGVVGPCLGISGNAVAPIAQQEKMPEVITTASGTEIQNTPYVLRAGIKQQVYAGKVIELLAKRGVKKIAFFYESSSPSIAQGVVPVQKEAAEKLGIKVVSEESAPETATDFSSQAQAIARSKPEAVGALFTGALDLGVLNALRQAGFTGQVWGNQGDLDEAFVKKGGPNVEGVVIAVGYTPESSEASSQKFTTEFKAKYNRTPTELSAHGYDATKLMLEGIANAKSTERQKVQEALVKIQSFEGAQGKVTMNERDASGAGAVVEIKHGELVGVPGS